MAAFFIPFAPIPVRPQCPRRSRLWLHHSLFRTQRFCRCLSLPSPSRHPCPLSVSPSQPSMAALSSVSPSRPYMAASGPYPAFPSSLFSYNKIVRQGFTPSRTFVLLVLLRNLLLIRNIPTARDAVLVRWPYPFRLCIECPTWGHFGKPIICIITIIFTEEAFYAIQARTI